MSSSVHTRGTSASNSVTDGIVPALRCIGARARRYSRIPLQENGRGTRHRGGIVRDMDNSVEQRRAGYLKEASFWTVFWHGYHFLVAVRKPPPVAVVHDDP